VASSHDGIAAQHLSLVLMFCLRMPPLLHTLHRAAQNVLRSIESGHSFQHVNI